MVSFRTMTTWNCVFHHGYNAFCQSTLSLQSNAAIVIQFLQKRGDPISPAQSSHICASSFWAKAHFHTTPGNRFAERRESLAHVLSAVKYYSRILDLLGNIERAISVETTTPKMALKMSGNPGRAIRPRFPFGHTMTAQCISQGLRRYSEYRHLRMFAWMLQYWMCSSQCSSKCVQMGGITREQRQTETPAVDRAVRVQHPKPVRLFFSIDHVEEMVIRLVSGLRFTGGPMSSASFLDVIPYCATVNPQFFGENVRTFAQGVTSYNLCLDVFRQSHGSGWQTT